MPALRRWVLLVLVVLPLPAMAAEWRDVRTAGRFVCHADFPLESISGLIDELPSLENDLVEKLGIAASTEPIEVYLFSDQGAYATYLAEYLPKVPYRRALYVKGEAAGMIFAYRSHDLAVDLRHEATHALVHAALVKVPLWLDEGLAVYFESPRDGRAAGGTYWEDMRRQAELGLGPDLASLEKISEPGQMDRAAYRDAWAVVHFAFHGPKEAGDDLRAHLANVGRPEPSLAERYARRWPNVSAQIVEHFKQVGWVKPEAKTHHDSRRSR